jgi:hypothetical protein
MNPARRGYREHAHDSHPNVSTCSTTPLALAQSNFAPDGKSVTEAGSKVRRKTGGESFVAVRTAATGSVPPVPVRLVRDCG